MQSIEKESVGRWNAKQIWNPQFYCSKSLRSDRSRGTASKLPMPVVVRRLHFRFASENATSITLLRLQIIQTSAMVPGDGRDLNEMLLSIAFGVVLNINVLHLNNGCVCRVSLSCLFAACLPCSLPLVQINARPARDNVNVCFLPFYTSQSFLCFLLPLGSVCGCVRCVFFSLSCAFSLFISFGWRVFVCLSIHLKRAYNAHEG